MFLLLLSTTLIVLMIWIYLHFKTRFTFWKKLNVPYLEPSFPTGNVSEILGTKYHFSHIMKDLYKRMKMFEDYGGIYFFHDPVLLVLTPEFAKTVLVKDSQHFIDRGVYSNEKDDPLSANLFFMEGVKWKKLRLKLTPTFTSGKLKMMFHTILGVSEEFKMYLEPYAIKNEDIEIKDLLARFTTDIVGSCGFGIDCNSIKNPDTKFRVMGRKIINMPKLKALKVFFAMMFRNTARKLGIRFNDEDVEEFFLNIVRETIEFREKNDVKRNDFMQLLIELKNNKDDDEKLTFEEIAAQAFVFFFAGFETSSTTLTFALYLLAINQEVQDKARTCIKSVLEKHKDKLSYDAVMEMVYLDWIINETLRIYPPVAALNRITTSEYKLPNGQIIPKGIGVIIPILGFHRDPEYFPDPMKFEPERFSEDSKQNRHSFCHIPFGEGPRICIGMRFGLLQTRMILAILLNEFRFNVCSKTEIPLKIDAVNLVHAPENDVWLNIAKNC